MLCLVIFRHIIYSQILRAVKNLIEDTLGRKSLDLPQYLSQALIPIPQGRGSRRAPRGPPALPQLLVTVPGTDPLQGIVPLASTRPDINLTLVSLGQGQV